MADAGRIEGDGPTSPRGAGIGRAGPSATEWAPGTSPGALALADLAEGFARWRLWGLMGWQDIRQRYRRSVLGPFWLTLSMAVLVGALGVLYGKLFGIAIDDYLPFLTLGFIAWGLIAAVVNEGCVALTAAEPFIKQMRLPFSLHLYRMTWRNLIIFGHNILIFVVVAVLFSIWPGWVGLLALPGLALICLNGVWAGLLLGLVSARFRDVPQIVASVVQVAFFLTPIIWKPELLPDRALVLDLNPFFHFVELVRAPLLGQAPGLASWLAVLGITLGGWLVTLAMYRRYRWRIAYWL